MNMTPKNHPALYLLTFLFSTIFLTVALLLFITTTTSAVTITSPADGAKLKGTVIIKGTASDSDGTVETVDILVDGEWFQATGTTTWEFQLDTAELENWDYVLKVLAFDGTDYSEDALLNITVANEKEGDGDGEAGFLPGFKIAAFLVGAVVGVAGWRRRKKT